MFRRKKAPLSLTADYLIVGLGNPGARYEMTRHNCGFTAIDLLAERLDVRVNSIRCKALTAVCDIGGKRVMLAKPQTYMNLSGEAVRDLCQTLSVPPERLLVVYDDCDMAAGRLRIRASGSSGTHNGMRNILYLLETDQFPRIRVGIGRPPEGTDLADYVLDGMDSDTYAAIKTVPDAILDYLEHGIEHAMQRFNTSAQKTKENSEPKIKKE